MKSKKLHSLGIIPDGNRTFANKSGISFQKAYMKGIDKAKEALTWVDDYKEMKEVTFYTLSLENLKRKKAELDILLRLFKKEMIWSLDSRWLNDNGIRARFIGRLDMLPKGLQKIMQDVENETTDNKRMNVNFAVAYTGQAEIADASRKIAEDYKAGKINLNDIDEQTFQNYLYKPIANPDLVIRTSNQQRLSGFLTYETAYSEFWFTPKLWPEIEQTDLADAVDTYYGRNRKFGL